MQERLFMDYPSSTILHRQAPMIMALKKLIYA